MLCCGAEIGIFVFGIITLIKGTFALSKARVVQGTPARIIGALLLLPLIAGQGGELLVGVMWGIERGMKGQQPANMLDAMQEAARELQVKALIINGIALGVPLLAALIIALSTAKPPPKKKRPRDEDDDLDDDERDDDRPRRRRRAREDDDEVEEERPRRRPARTDDDPGDDRIRRRKGPNDD